MKSNDLRDLTDDELRLRVNEFKDELFNLRFQLATNQLDNKMRIREVKKKIARVLTVQRERELRASQA